MKQPTTRRKAVTRYSQPQVVVVQEKTPLIVALILSGNMIDQRTKKTVTEAETQNMTGSNGLVLALLCDIYLSLTKCVQLLSLSLRFTPLWAVHTQTTCHKQDIGCLRPHVTEIIDIVKDQ
jgi:hypothetical protein